MLPVCPCALSKQGTGTCKVKLLAKVRRCRTFSRSRQNQSAALLERGFLVLMQKERCEVVMLRSAPGKCEVRKHKHAHFWGNTCRSCTKLSTQRLSYMHSSTDIMVQSTGPNTEAGNVIFIGSILICAESFDCSKKKKKKLRIKIKNLRAFSAISNRSDFRINYIIQRFMISNNQHPTPKIQLLWTLKKIQAHAIKLHVFIRLFVSLGHVLEDSSKIIFK